MNFISDNLMKSPRFIDGVETLLLRKPKMASVLKALEEFAELSTKLLQSINKENCKLDLEILEEMVDVQMHLILMQQYYTQGEIVAMVEEKITKMIKSKDFNYYKNLSK